MEDLSPKRCDLRRDTEPSTSRANPELRPFGYLPPHPPGKRVKAKDLQAGTQHQLHSLKPPGPPCTHDKACSWGPYAESRSVYPPIALKPAALVRVMMDVILAGSLELKLDLGR